MRSTPSPASGIAVFFFFQAEDGIRDADVTGVQTCALPISLLGFLRYNFPPATIFLGDSGSMLIGLTVGVLAIQSSLKGAATVALAAPAAVQIGRASCRERV